MAKATAATMKLDVRRHVSVTSTMDLAARAVEAGAREGLVICADEQTAGRGRRGRSWASPPGAGLYLSFVLRPPHEAVDDDRSLALVTLTAGVAVREAIWRVSQLVSELKWPNDVMVGRRKLAGILAEGHAIGSPNQAIVLGVGINVCRSSYPPDIAERATSLETELGREVDRTMVLDAVLAAVPEWYGRLRAGEADDILQAWRSAAPTAHGARVEWDDGKKRGRTAGLDDSGALLVKVDGRVERIISADLRWLESDRSH